MTIISLILTLLIVGVLLWGLSRLEMIDPMIKNVIYVIVVVCVVLWLISSIGGDNHILNRRMW